RPKGCWSPMRTNSLLCLQVLWELIRYDLIFAVRGLNGVRRAKKECASVRESDDPVVQRAVCEAVRCVVPLYWKPVRCLQRSIVTARLMRRRGVEADVVIGYRAVPFLSHAWVEVGGRVVNDSPTFKIRLQVLDRL